jgi:hypothetical protein
MATEEVTVETTGDATENQDSLKMSMRIHSMSTEPKYYADFEYVRQADVS